MNDNRVEIFKGKGRHPWYVRLMSPNGGTFSISDGYYSKWNAKRAASKMFPGLKVKETQA